nr:F-box/LRR-repeat protein 8 isoform X2 [Pongo pygmaeus]XP_054309829.1 F-box/LRR-repeat protein 8 isoform X2 [Pongo pygmaeus]
MAEPGEGLPEEVLALIFRHLSLRDRAAAARVCRAWAAAATCSAVWHDTKISCECELEGMLPPYLSACLDHVHKLRLEFEPSRKPSRRAAIELLMVLAGRALGLRGLRLECRGEKPLFDAGRDILEAVHAVCGAASQLRHLDLRCLPFTLDDALVLQAARSCPELHSLFLDNSTLVGSVGPGSVLKLLEACPRLRALGLHLASLSHAILEALAAPDRAPFALLALRCACPEDARASPLPNEAWVALRRRHPGLAVELELEPALPAESVTRVLQPAVPVAALRLNLSGDTVGPVRFAAHHYAATLCALEVRAAASAELNAALEELAARCAALREVHCFCVTPHPLGPGHTAPLSCLHPSADSAAPRPRRGEREGTGAGRASGDLLSPHQVAHRRFLPYNKEGNRGTEKGGTRTQVPYSSHPTPPHPTPPYPSTPLHSTHPIQPAFSACWCLGRCPSPAPRARTWPPPDPAPRGGVGRSGRQTQHFPRL